jgi:gas vesicle protein
MGCFSAASHIANDASSYLRTVQRLSSRSDDSLPGFGTAEVAERYFPADKLGRSVVRDLAYGLGLLLTGLAVLSLALSAIGSAGLAALATNPYTIAAPAMAALLLFVAAESIYLAQRREARRMCWTLDELFLVPASMLTAEHLTASLRASADRQREALASLADDLRRAVTESQDTLGKALKSHDEAFFESMSERLHNALQAPAKALSEAAKANAKDQSGRVKALVEELLKAYVAELTVMERTQLEGLKDVLAEMLAATRALQEAFEAGADRVASDAVERAGALTTRLEELVSDDFGHSVRAIRTAADGLNETTAGLGEAAAGLRDTITQLQAALAALPAQPAPAPAPARTPPPSRRTSNEIADILGEFQEEADKLSRSLGRR